MLDNLDVIAKSVPALKYVQIDDGYQSAMGDWLDTGAAFGGNVRTVLSQIRRRGFEPAIWVAPFVAEEKSNAVPAASRTGSSRTPTARRCDPIASLSADGGAGRGTRSTARTRTCRPTSSRVFRTMREEWGCTYFKLDANFWGAMHGGRFHDPRATRIEAYRRGMQAVLRGAGDSFILGCNHPIWPSTRPDPRIPQLERHQAHLGSRSRRPAARTCSRNWQNGRLWWNDPDAIVLASDLTDAECQFHATVIYASGGMVLSGDDLTKLPPARAAMLKKLLPPTGVAAAFEDGSLRAGTVVAAGCAHVVPVQLGGSPRTRVRCGCLGLVQSPTSGRANGSRRVMARSRSRCLRDPRVCSGCRERSWT